MAVLVTGGDGCSGSHMSYALIDRREKVVVLNDLAAGVRASVSERAAFVQDSVNNTTQLRQIIRDHAIDSVIHFAGSVVVPESVADPLNCFANNTCASRSLTEACVIEGVRQFLFSSTVAVYGPQGASPVTEGAPTAPINPDGRSKLMTEWVLEQVSRAHDRFRHVIMRYFNVAGADSRGRTGQSTRNATHLNKRSCQVAVGRLPYLKIFGTDLAKPDGTGVRDYVHVMDLVEVHLLALDSLRDGASSATYNCGYGGSFSVREIVAVTVKIIKHSFATIEAPRRDGDAPAVIADSSPLKSVLNWQPKFDNLDTIIRSALEWEGRLANI